ncbi:50S ribosomal protein L22 [Medicago truncatula]|uniref:Large ribosomal subunit protein uL22c n=1 Tax=Medicago truncatula TaxID=3880 RepID=B7FN77_MEDTR|nr:50S ribosomal protein L22, chloroplastic [Medicago truncatula]ACJ86210.1 unknown [Medicago truncatula]AES81770.2 50S ribosomal protein L22 [Medicago truncatula]AFK48875.1 unknown [Medicago truncatula]RHN48407.1 50S ribosomal protein L22 [Medicago truncatula]
MALSLTAINLPPPPVRDNALASQFQFRPNLLKFPKIPSSSSSFNGISLKTVTPDNNNPFACHVSSSQFGVQESNKSYAEAVAVGKHIRMSADKARRVIDTIRGRPYEETLMILELMPYRACETILKIVFSAGANASNNLGLSKSSLVISKAEVNEGRTMKRTRPRAQGRANQILKRTCHITITVKGLPAESVVEASSS